MKLIRFKRAMDNDRDRIEVSEFLLAKDQFKDHLHLNFDRRL